MLGLAAVAVLICAMVLLVEPEPIPGLPASQRQNAETAVYAISLLAIIPLALAVAPRLAGAIARGPNESALSGLTACLVLGLAGVLLAARAIDELAGGGTEILLAGLVAWGAGAGAALHRAARAPEWRAGLWLRRRAGALWLAAAATAAATPVVVTALSSLSPAVAAVGVVAVVLCARRRVPALGGRAGLAMDALAIVLLALLIPDLVVVRTEDPGLSPLDRYLASIMQFHHNFLVGPANQVMGGDVLLRDTASQYGVGSIYFLTGWFELLTISYGSFALLDGLLTAGLFCIAYVVLRMAGCSRAVAWAAMAVAVVALVFNRVYAVGMLPQEGPFRFGLPMLVILAAVTASHRPGWASPARAAGLVAVGVSAVWSLEAFAATVAVFAALAGIEAWLLPAGERMRLFLRRSAQALAAVVAAHLLFAAAVLIGTGHLPGWGQYLAFLDEFLFGPLGDLTYDFDRWSAGLALGAAYLASTLTLLLVLKIRLPLASERRTAFTAIAGVTAYGLVQFAYLVDRSAEHVVVYVALPGVMLAALWLSQVPDRARSAAVAVAGSAAVLLVAAGWSSVQRPLEHSALSQLLPGGDSPRGAIARLRAFPAIDSAAPEGERLMDTHMPGEDRSVVLVEPNLSVEVLTRRKRANALRLSNPREDDFTFDERLPGVLEAVDELKPGRRVLIDAGALAALAELRRNPRSKVRTQGTGTVSILQARALEAIDRRFRLRPVARGSGGLAVAELLDR